MKLDNGYQQNYAALTNINNNNGLPVDKKTFHAKASLIPTDDASRRPTVGAECHMINIVEVTGDFFFFPGFSFIFATGNLSAVLR